jgi:aspartyl-tRNA(Asn)/glutamyl-tRNA(Gln) amidotransferase subunit B
MSYIPVIGLEIHAELLTHSKVFCSCSAEFGGLENTRVCPRCAALPGTLPIFNREVAVFAIKAGFALGCKIHNYSSFDRKNYFYPDLPKAYQITQFEHPICTDGRVNIGEKDIRINRIHIEEDAGKLIHDADEGVSLADYNRCGVPLIEIVTEPDIRSSEEAKRFVEEVALRLKYTGVCDAKMEQGSLRVDVNISLMQSGSDTFGVRAEIKNLNSLKSIGRAIEYEIIRQKKILDSGGQVMQETRRYNEEYNDTRPLRSKEKAHDYRYFPEPDIPPVWMTDEEIAAIQSSMPEMPHERIERYMYDYHLPNDDARLLTCDKALSDFYDRTVSLYPSYRTVANLILVELLRNMNVSGICASDLALPSDALAKLARMTDEGRISKNAAKNLLSILFEQGGDPMEIASQEGMLLEENTETIKAAIHDVIFEHEQQVQSYLLGNEKVFGFLMGQVMKQVGNSANPPVVRALLQETLNSMQKKE